MLVEDSMLASEDKNDVESRKFEGYYERWRNYKLPRDYRSLA